MGKKYLVLVICCQNLVALIGT